MRIMRCCHAGCLIAALLVMSACSSLPSAPHESARGGWRVVRQDSVMDVRVRADLSSQSLESVRLGEVAVVKNTGRADHAADNPADSEALEDLRTALADRLHQGLKNADQAKLTMNIRLLEARPVSPALNALSAVVLFVPLDTGSIVVEAELLSREGEKVALWRERVSGDYLDIGSGFSRWGRVRNALEKWAQRCLEEPAWLTANSSNLS